MSALWVIAGFLYIAGGVLAILSVREFMRLRAPTEKGGER